MRDTSGRLLSHLPAIYRESETLSQLLGLFEDFLFTKGPEPLATHPRCESSPAWVSINESIVTLSRLIDPFQTPSDFLPWLSQWVALSDYEGIKELQQRRLIEKIIPLYASRGTKTYLAQLLALFTPQNTRIHIDDNVDAGFTLGNAKLGIETILSSDQPFRFKVNIVMPAAMEYIPDGSANQKIWRRRLRRVIDLAKPVHTVYQLECTNKS
jgi:phage tail-like protein